MAISFQCPQCGKKLKAPESAAGRSSKCPGCGGVVTCPTADDDPEPVEMTLEPERPGGLDPYADLGADERYRMAEARASQATATDARRPCPMCGELIAASATKCQFCGESLGVAAPKPKKKGKKGQIRQIARYQKYLLNSLAIMIVSWLSGIGVAIAAGQSAQGPLLIVLIVLLVAQFVSAISAWVLSVMLASKLYSTGGTILVFVLQFVPCVNLITMLVVSNKASSILRDKGIEVGFLGADMSQF